MITQFFIKKEDVDEAKITDSSRNVAEEIRNLDPRLANVEDTTINDCMGIYAKDLGIKKTGVLAEDFVDWFNNSDSIGSFIFDFQDELFTHSIADLGKEDPDFKKAVMNVAKRQRFIDDEMHDVTYAGDDGQKGPVISFEKLIYNLFEDACKGHDGKVIPSMRADMFKAIEKEFRKIHTKTESMENDLDFDEEEYIANAKEHAEEILKGTEENARKELADYNFEEIAPVDEAEEIIYAAIQKRLSMNEAFEEESADIIVPETAEKTVEQEVQEPVADVISSEINEPTTDETIDAAAFGETINSLIKAEWEVISELNSVLATIKLSYFKENKEDIEKILNSILDDHTIDVGMLYKVYDLLGNKTSDLLDAGAEKAEEIISEPAADLE